MQLGITIPLQKHLNIKTLPYGEQSDLFYCWELHIIRLQGKNTLAAVNASNRFAIVLWGMKAAEWKTLEEVMQNGIRRGFLSEGYTEQQVNAYFKLAGEVSLTKTHGRISRLWAASGIFGSRHEKNRNPIKGGIAIEGFCKRRPMFFIVRFELRTMPYASGRLLYGLWRR